MMVNFLKLLSTLTMFGSMVLLLTACGGSNATTPVAQQKVNTNEKLKSISLDFYMGDIAQAEGVLSIPVILTNSGTDRTVISSQNFFLKIENHTFKSLQVPNEPSDFHYALGSNQTWGNTISFYIGTELLNKDLKKVSLVYRNDNGIYVKAKFIDSANAQQKTQNINNSQYLSVGDYYLNAKNYIKQTKDIVKSGGNANSLMSQFQDSKFDQFRLWIVVSSKFPEYIIIKAINNTNSNLIFSFSDIELRDKNKNDFLVHPTYRDYNALISHGKAINIIVPMESKLKAKNKPYQIYLRSSEDNEFNSTQNSFNPAEFSYNNSKDFSSVLSTTPDQYPKSGIKWLLPKLDKNSLKIRVKLYDYFYVTYTKSRFELVGLNNDGTVGENVKPYKVTPTKITNTGSDVEFKFSDLTVVKTYKKIALRYNNKTLCTIK